MTDWLARAQLVAAELCQQYRQIDSTLADNEAQEAAMLYELCPKLRKWDFDGWVCHRVWVAHLLHKQKKALAENAGAENTEDNMARGVYLTDEQKQRIVSDISCGMSTKAVAEKYGLGYSTAAKLAHDYKVRAAGGEAVGNDREAVQDGFVFAESMTNEQRAQYTADVIAEVEGTVSRCENAAENAQTLPESSEPDEDVSGPGRITVKQLIKLHWTDDILYFYEYYDEFEPGVTDGKWDFSGVELFLAYHSSVSVENMLAPQVLERTVRRIYNDDGVIRIVVDKQEVKSYEH